MKVLWDPVALARLEAEGDFVARDSPQAAAKVVSRILDAVDDLAVFPLKGRQGRVIGTRELVIPRTSYIVAYRVRGEIVQILAVQHAAEQWPSEFE